jgi:succinate dehydrogenase/fumarate reductase cytochrome b subunit
VATDVRDEVSDRAPIGRGAGHVEPSEPADRPAIDWTGRGRAAGGGDADDGTGSGDPGGASATRRLAVVAGAVSFAYIVWLVVDLMVLAASGSAYTSMHDALGSLWARVALSVAWLALLYHGVDGLRVAVIDAVPRLHDRDRGLRGLVAFVVLATWIPTSLALVWPAIRGWFAA